MKLTEAMTPTGNPQSTYARSIVCQLGQEQEAGSFFIKPFCSPCGTEIPSWREDEEFDVVQPVGDCPKR